MKLISFAVISLLGITVSSQILPSTSAADDTLQSDQNLIRDTIQKLEAAYPAQQEVVSKIRGIEELEHEEWETRLMMERLADALRQDITSEFWRLNLERLYDDAVQDWEKEYGKMMAKKEELRQAKEERNSMVVKIHILKENQELQTGRDAHSRGQMGAYSGSNYPRKILEGQIDEACRNADDLFIANEAINEGINMLDDVIGREKGTKKGKLDKPQKKIVSSFQKLAGMTKFTQGYCTNSRGIQMDFGWQPQSSGIGKVFQSLWKKF
ncbi:hypothetical protein BASA50_007651 [Batrachochytrium salamandrivorans]|uniref:SXP/RAL-2 family protein Ani s 5-like cation-binding domain-containing protein n=1 Tax=Batrachochytrium salamandrivorans TaxID=1357716 RepID=A0ABQ8F6B2_9FUNG|nr:hypothetical protein BASA50_007651 [Batrachochytrium salamandrivorans]